VKENRCGLDAVKKFFTGIKFYVAPDIHTGSHPHLGPILQNSIIAENYSDTFSSSNFVEISSQKRQI
jgi:hypothetical protein